MKYDGVAGAARSALGRGRQERKKQMVSQEYKQKRKKLTSLKKLVREIIRSLDELWSVEYRY